MKRRNVMAKNPYTSQREAAERSYLIASQRAANATTPNLRRSALTSMQSAERSLLRLRQSEERWNSKNNKW